MISITTLHEIADFAEQGLQDPMAIVDERHADEARESFQRIYDAVSVELAGTIDGSLFGELQRRGFIPNERYGTWFDLWIGGDRGRLSVPPWIVAVEQDDQTTVVHLLTGNRVSVSDVRLSEHVPLSIVTSVIDATIAQAVTS